MRIRTTVSLVVLLVAIGAGVSAVSAQTAADLVERAAAASAEGRTDEALRDLNAAIRLEPKYAPAYARRGLLHAQADVRRDLAQKLDRLALEVEVEGMHGRRSSITTAVDRFRAPQRACGNRVLPRGAA